ncbi:MAG: thiol-disulfide oxidoreductase DCC [Waddliaceae bacterium]|nr:thiol-disulfide oxidoreductase DCC [Waddliaceae bacterium]
MAEHLVYYDGECGMCARSVQFILKRDRKKCFLFAPLQGETAKQNLKEMRDQDPDLDSMVLVENRGKPTEATFFRSKAAFRIAWYLGGRWKVFGILSFIPLAIFDPFYRLIAKNRKRFFSSADTCKVPTEEERKRFLP